MRTVSPPLFVTGTDTGVGKTQVASALCHSLAARGLRVAGMKPLASGCERTPEGLRNDDALALMAAANVRAGYDEVNPYAFEPAIAPHIAAAEAGVEIDYERLDHCMERLRLQSQVLVIEGAGGWLAPLDSLRGFGDLAGRWQAEVILVVGLRLGCLNHALLTVESITRRGLGLCGWVGSCIDPGFARLQANIDTLSARIAAPRLGVLPFAPQSSAEQRAASLDLDTLLRGLGLS